MVQRLPTVTQRWPAARNDDMAWRMIYAPERLVQSVDDCWFYHVMDLPTLGTVGEEWDLRGRLPDYLGHTDVGGKRVLDVGTASGFLTFEMEKRGAEVVSFDADGPDKWQLLPIFDDLFWRDRLAWNKAWGAQLEKLKNGYWLAHRLLKSSAKVAYGTVYDIPAELGQFDVTVIGQILVHLSDPVTALSSVLMRSRERIVITEGMTHNDAPIMRLCGRAATKVSWSWWHLSTGLYRELLAMAGFEIERIQRGKYLCVNPVFAGETELTTIVGRRISATD